MSKGLIFSKKIKTKKHGGFCSRRLILLCGCPVRVPARQPPRPPPFRGGQLRTPRPVSPAASEEYYQLLVSSESHGCGADVPSCTVGEIARAASEFILKNAVSVPPCRPAPTGASWRPCGQSSSVDAGSDFLP